MEFAPFWASAVGLAIGAGMGLYGLISPHWSARLVRLREEEGRPGGFAEFRSTYGGLFLASHGFALVFMVSTAREVEALAGLPTHFTALGAAGACGLMWLGSALGRSVAIAMDGAGTRYNQASVVFEIVLGGLILAPWLLRP